MLAAATGLAAAGEAVAAKYAAIVIDANTGKTLHSSSADAPRYPASLTKMMTLYLTFEALQAGKISKKTQIPFSAQAATKPPTKLGVKAGKSVSVETIIYSLVTKSANDSAAAIAEYLGGSEQGFARLMTAKAKRLGMTGTVFRNASGLPDTSQHSTARDMALLGVALREHFPQYYGYFSTKSFAYGRQRMANHNKLLGRIKGVDGIKTGYTRASGFNLVSSVSDGNRRIVAVVMGGQSGAARDRQVAALIKEYLPRASSKRGGQLVAKSGNAPVVAEASGDSPLKALAKVILPKKKVPMPDTKPADEVVVAAAEEPAPVALVTPPKKKKTLAEPLPERFASETIEQGYAEEAPRPKLDVDPVKTASVAPSGWAVQVGSSPSENEAKAALSRTHQQAGRILGGASPYTVTFDKDGTTYYRARFGGFETKTAAWNACNALKKKKIACYAVQQ